MRNDKGVSALMLAAQYGHVEVARFFAQQGADLEIRDKQGRSAFIFAAQNGHDKVMEILAEHGADKVRHR